MSRVRIVIEGTFDDYETFSDVAKRMCAHVEEHEPGTEAYEVFADQEVGRFAWHDLYADNDAFLAHVQGMTEAGLMDEFMAATNIERVTSLARVTDDRVGEVLDQFGAIRLHGLVGVVR